METKNKTFQLLILFILLSFFLAIIRTYGQEKEKSIFSKKNELKIGAIKLLAGSILEGTYEYINSSYFTFGSSLLINANSKNEYIEGFSITPFARFYFLETKEFGSKGFFVEGFAKFSNGKYKNSNFEERKSYNASSLGFSIGKKWTNNSGFVFELLLGLGRPITKSETAPDLIFRGDINIGYRF